MGLLSGLFLPAAYAQTTFTVTSAADAGGTRALPALPGNGIYLFKASDSEVGGTEAGAANVVTATDASGNTPEFSPSVTVDSDMPITDTYRTALRNQLQSEYGITGGTWVLGETEEEVFTAYSPTAEVTVQPTNVQGHPFTTALRFEVQSAGLNPWDRGTYFATKQPIDRGDVLLLVVWVRSLDAERGDGAARSIVGENQPPFNEPLRQTHLLTDSWQQWLLPFEATLDLPLGRGQYGIQMGYMQQTVEVGGLALLNYGDAYQVEDLPRSSFDLDYAGREPGAAWRAEAQARIEQHRKADLDVRVVDAGGQPLEGVEVNVMMQQHAFGFGTAVNVPTFVSASNDAQIYREKLADLTGDGRSFSYAVTENGMKWPVWEGQAPWFIATQTQTIDVVQTLHEQGKRVRGHALIWPAWNTLPPDLEQNQNDLGYLRQRVSEHIAALAGHPDLQAPIVAWDVLNEPAHLFDLQDAFGGREAIIDEYATWFNEAVEAAPTAKMYVNDYGIISQGGIGVPTQARYREIIRAIKDAGGQIDGIGLQGHVNTPLASPETVYQLLDEYAALASELSITEYDATDVPEDLAADYLRDLLTIAFSHPAVSSFVMWGFWDGNHWRGDAPLYRQDWSLKPSGEAFLQLVFDDWWTNVEGQTGTDGTFSARGFLGDYDVSVTHDGVTQVGTVTLPADGRSVEITMLPATVEVAINRTFDDAADPQDYRLVALPGAVDTALAATLDGAPDVAWQAFWDDGSDENFLIKHDGSERFHFRPGRGFWLVSTSPWAVGATVKTVPLGSDGTVALPLHDGWNVLSNPLDRDVRWADVSAVNGDALQTLWAWDATFAPADTFRSAAAGEAFYFLNDQGLDALQVPYPGVSAVSAPVARKQHHEEPALALTAVQAGRTTSQVQVGFHSAAQAGLDAYDQFAPPGHFEAASLRLKAPGPAPSGRQRYLAHEWRPPVGASGEGQTFDLVLRSAPNVSVHLYAASGNGHAAALIDPVAGRTYDLHAGRGVQIIPQDTTTALQLAVGRLSYVEAAKERVRPEAVALLPNYPNPFRGQTSLEYALPERAEVRLTVYDVLGRQVRLLEHREQSAGMHALQWDGRGASGALLASGLYFVRMEAMGQTHVQKVTLVR